MTNNIVTVPLKLVNVPIAALSFVKSQISANTGYRIFYAWRGPRVGLDNRSKSQQQSWCLKKNATHFTVYFYEK